MIDSTPGLWHSPNEHFQLEGGIKLILGNMSPTTTRKTLKISLSILIKTRSRRRKKLHGMQMVKKKYPKRKKNPIQRDPNLKINKVSRKELKDLVVRKSCRLPMRLSINLLVVLVATPC